MKKELTAILAVLLAISSPVYADAPCSSFYDASRQAISKARIGHGLKMQLDTRVENAWRTFRSGKSNAKKDALLKLAAASSLLRSNATKQIPFEIKWPVDSAIKAFRKCTESAEFATSTVTVRVVRFNPTRPSGLETVSGAIIRVNDAEVGKTDATGLATVSVPAGQDIISAIVYPSEEGETTISSAAGTSLTMDLRVDDAEPTEHTRLTLDEAPDSVLPYNFESFTLRFLDSTETTVPMQAIEDVHVRRADTAGSYYLDRIFSVAADGTIRPSDLVILKQALSQPGHKDLFVSAIDRNGRMHAGTLSLYPGGYALQGRLVAPPSNRSLPLQEISVSASLLGTDLVFWAISGSDGSFAFAKLPAGNVDIEAHETFNAVEYHGLAVVTLPRFGVVAVNMLTTIDKQKNN